MKDAKDSVLENHNWLFHKISKSQEKYGFLASAFIMSEKWGNHLRLNPRELPWTG